MKTQTQKLTININKAEEKQVLHELEQTLVFMYRELKDALNTDDYERLGEDCDKLYDDVAKLLLK